MKALQRLRAAENTLNAVHTGNKFARPVVELRTEDAVAFLVLCPGQVADDYADHQ
jgi:hypothetical protein